MFEDINKDLERLQQGIYRLKKIETIIDNLKIQLEEQLKKEQEFKKELGKEQLDVEKLGRMNLTTIFYTILGSKEEQKDKERREALAAQLKYEEILKQIEDSKYQIHKLTNEKEEYATFEQSYEKLFQEKYTLLKQSNSKDAKKVSDLEKTIAFHKLNLKEIEEAMIAGNRVIETLKETEKSLNSAEGWGTWDMWGGRGLITNMIKHSHIDDAKDTASKVQKLLNHFRAELTDVKITSRFNIDIDGFTKFADIFFDGLITDWIVQSRIHNSLDSVKKVQREVNNVLDLLNQKKKAKKEELAKLENELLYIVESVQ